MMDQIRFFGFINGSDSADRFTFPDRVDPFAGKVEYDMTKSGFLQFFDVFSIRRKETDFPSFALQKAGVFQPEIIEIPVGVCKKNSFQCEFSQSVNFK